MATKLARGPQHPRPDYPFYPPSAVWQPLTKVGYKRPKGRKGKKPKGRRKKTYEFANERQPKKASAADLMSIHQSALILKDRDLRDRQLTQEREDKIEQKKQEKRDRDRERQEKAGALIQQFRDRRKDEQRHQEMLALLRRGGLGVPAIAGGGGGGGAPAAAPVYHPPVYHPPVYPAQPPQPAQPALPAPPAAPPIRVQVNPRFGHRDPRADEPSTGGMRAPVKGGRAQPDPEGSGLARQATQVGGGGRGGVEPEQGEVWGWERSTPGGEGRRWGDPPPEWEARRAQAPAPAPAPAREPP